MTSKLIRTLVVIALVVYPFIIYFGLNSFSFYMIGGALLVVFSLRVLLTWNSNGVLQQQKWLGLLGLALAGFAVIRQEQTWFQLYPLLVNIVLCAVFMLSLADEQPIIEKFARLSGKAIPVSARSYFIKLTKVWCVFFVLNALVSGWTIFAADIETWTLYNGLISYMLIASLLAGEWILRKCFKLEEKYE
ncbi:MULTISPECIES: septation protein IspZ [unclassified Agarivorans]|uniref:septation protein IspZ n=1 Tax=unclassified Agarivorans TaxID=2636026 RepID=UPI0026E36A3B|nr:MULTISPECIES: septation protein IspZ [unclassified Agarivorans]MDO6685296.1 septation protein IspZ [Agarivorans sp. 3_MG-2023]MDO6715532.1 septation protein IspZ [Agarivorans sp. 2_MG-2023]